MKRKTTLLGSLIALAMLLSLNLSVNAQEEEESSSPFDAGVDLFSSYVWRGSFVHGASLQPWASVAIGDLEIGAWGAYEITLASGVPAEADLYVSYAISDLSVGVTDYYYPGGLDGWFNFSDTSGNHAIELNVGYEIMGFSIGANYIFNEAAFAASDGGDMYFELGYSYENLSAFVGLGNGWHTNEAAAGEDLNSDGEYDDKFAVCNLGVMISKDVVKFPVTAGIVLNPYTKDFHVVAGISF